MTSQETGPRPQVREPETSPLRKLVRVVGRSRWMVAVALVAALSVAVGFSLLQEARYSATAQVLLNGDAQALAAGVTGVPVFASALRPERETATQAVLARTPGVVDRVLEQPEAQDVTRGELLSSITVSESPDTNILSFTFTSSDPERAARLATEYARQYTVFRTELDTAAIEEARVAVQERLQALEAANQQGSELYAGLVEKEQQLLTLATLQESNALLVQPALGAGQIQPRPVRNGAIGLLVGLVVGVGCAFLREALDTRLGSGDELADALGVPLLGRLPEPPRRLREHDLLVMLEDPHSPGAEAFRMLRTNLDFVAVGRDVRTLLVTSAVEAEGKSTTVSNLAIAMVRAGRRVALVDLDLRRSYLARFFPSDRRQGMTDVVLGSATLDDVLLRVPVPGGGSTGEIGGMSSVNGHPGDGDAYLEVLLAGTLPPNPGELAGGAAVRRVLQELAQRVEVVIIDSPPVMAVGDALSVSASVDAVLVIARLDQARRRVVNELRRVLQASPAVPLGVAVTGSAANDAYYRAYPYAYGERAQSTSQGKSEATAPEPR